MKDIDLLYNWCFGCNNHRKSLKGPICEITEKRPDFTISCSNYIENAEKLKKSQQKIIELNHKNDDLIENIKPTLLQKQIKELPVELVLRNKKFDFSFIHILLIDFFGAYLFYYLSNDSFNILHLEFAKNFGYLTIFSIPIYGIILAKMADQSQKLVISKNGIKIENKTLIDWNNTFTYIMTKYANAEKESSWMRNEYLVIKKTFEKEIIIPIDSLEKNPSELSNLIENYKKRPL